MSAVWLFDPQTLNHLIPTSSAALNRITWWRHQMEAFTVLLAVCAGISPITGEFPTQRPVTRSFVSFGSEALNKRLGKRSWGWWFKTPLRPLWRHCDEMSSREITGPCLDNSVSGDILIIKPAGPLPVSNKKETRSSARHIIWLEWITIYNYHVESK